MLFRSQKTAEVQAADERGKAIRQKRLRQAKTGQWPVLSGCRREKQRRTIPAQRPPFRQGQSQRTSDGEAALDQGVILISTRVLYNIIPGIVNQNPIKKLSTE